MMVHEYTAKFILVISFLNVNLRKQIRKNYDQNMRRMQGRVYSKE